MYEHETRLHLLGEDLDVIVQFEPDEEDILISSVMVRRCVKERGDIDYSTSGNYPVRFPKYVEVEVFPVLSGSQIAALVEEILAEREAEDWSCVMNEPMTIRFNFPPQFAGVRL